MLANWITLSRFPLLLLSVLILYFGSATLRLAGVALLFLGLMLDTVDGMVARKPGRRACSEACSISRPTALTSWSCGCALPIYD
ncbi:MAG: CDP-alcohol phosphatidyltransferase family protein [Gemmatimonadales bacterium]